MQQIGHGPYQPRLHHTTPRKQGWFRDGDLVSPRAKIKLGMAVAELETCASTAEV